MTPAELAARHPRLFHLTLPSNLPGIERHGLLSTSRLLDLHRIQGDARTLHERTCRPAAVDLHHAVHGRATLNDQSPLSERALIACLDEELSPADWLIKLNRRVFFWADEAGLAALLNARANRNREVLVLVVDTARLAHAYETQIDLSAINTGNTRRQPVRRGHATFTRLAHLAYAEWAVQRGLKRPDTIREVTVLNGVPDIMGFVHNIRTHRPATAPPVTHRPV